MADDAKPDGLPWPISEFGPDEESGEYDLQVRTSRGLVIVTFSGDGQLLDAREMRGYGVYRPTGATAKQALNASAVQMALGAKERADAKARELQNENEQMRALLTSAHPAMERHTCHGAEDCELCLWTIAVRQFLSKGHGTAASDSVDKLKAALVATKAFVEQSILHHTKTGDLCYRCGCKGGHRTIGPNPCPWLPMLEQIEAALAGG